MSKNKIYIKDWLEFKPYKNHTNIDVQFVEIANKINSILQQITFLKKELGYYTDDIKELSIFLTCYLEDLVSGTNIWNTFIAIHEEKYNKKLPFYELKDYQLGEVNKVDIQFLIWYFFNLKMPERFLSPYDDYLGFLATDVFKVLDDEFEYVDENEKLMDFFDFDSNFDYYETRSQIQTVLFESYLFKIDAVTKLKIEIAESLNTSNYDESLNIRIINSITDKITNTHKTKLLALTGKDWLAEILGRENKMYNVIKNISEKISSWFLYKGGDNKYIHFQHIASDVMFNITKESYNANFELSYDAIYYVEMINWNNEWTFSGITFKKEFNADLILDEKNDMLKRNIGTQFDKKTKEKTKIALKNQEDYFIKLFKSPILFVDAKDIQSILDKFMNGYNKNLSKTEEEEKQKLEESKKRLREKGYFGEENILKKIEEGNFVVFYNPNSGIEMYNNICSIFADNKNSFYEGENVNKIKMFLFSSEYSKEFTNYFIENYADKFEFFKEGTGKKYLKDFDFLLRFWKSQNYFAKPSITLI